ncbi:MAG: hypothetical protein QNJ13_11010, partial [Paracoccaceae bacterium]|nr:hypothetical protein [Paracoccaceae bacterium]
AEALDAISDLPVECDPATGEPASKQRPASGALDRVRLTDLMRPDPETGLDLGMMKLMFRTDLRDRGLLEHPDLTHAEDWALAVSLLRAGVKIGLLREARYLFTARIGADSGQISPFSVTSVNYRAVAASTAALLKDMAGDPALTPELRALAEARIRNLLKQNRLWGWTMLRKGEWRRFRDWLASDPRNIGTVLEIVRRKALGHRGLPDWE